MGEDRRAETHLAFLCLGAARICWSFIKRGMLIVLSRSRPERSIEAHRMQPSLSTGFREKARNERAEVCLRKSPRIPPSLVQGGRSPSAVQATRIPGAQLFQG